MIRSASRQKSHVPGWHQGFSRMMPAICLHARVCFRNLDPESREEAVQNCLSNAMIAYLRLYELGRVELAYPSALARYAVAQTKDGRVTGSHLNIRDVSSPYCQAKKKVVMERLDQYDSEERAWKEILIADQTCTPADLAASRIDFPAWLDTLSRRDRKVALKLAAGEQPGRVAKLCCVSAGRISQLRRELHAAWQRFIGEEPETAAA
jgi:hypothetical protein